MEKTFNILIEETKRNIVTAINNANLPIYVTNSILKDLYNETTTMYKNLYKQEQKEYDSYLQEQQLSQELKSVDELEKDVIDTVIE